MQKYILNFDGSLGDYIRLMRKSKKINSIELSKRIGKSESYISHIENGRYKTPDYATLFEVFKLLGIQEEKIEDYLYYFHVLSPERISHEEAQAIAMAERMENPTQEDLDEMDREAEFHRQQEEEQMLEEEIKRRFEINTHQTSGTEESNRDVMDDMLDAHVVSINKVFANMIDHDTINAFDFVLGLSNTLDSVSTNVNLYKFMIKFFSEKINTLDNEGLVKVLNTLYEELNRVDREKTAFGKPRQRSFINGL